MALFVDYCFRRASAGDARAAGLVVRRRPVIGVVARPEIVDAHFVREFPMGLELVDDVVRMRKTIPVARRVFGDSNEVTLKMRWIYAEALGSARDSTPDDLREATATLEDAARIARRVFGGAHPLTEWIERVLRDFRKVLAAHDAGTL